MNYFIYKNLKFLSIKIPLITSIFPFTFLNANETKYQKVSMEEKNIYLNVKKSTFGKTIDVITKVTQPITGLFTIYQISK